MSNPFFSIVIPAYNRSKMTAEAIESVLNQSYTDYEVIVVDDGSEDDTPEIEEKFKGRISYFRQENAGGAAARNLGIEHSAGSYICYLDSDDLWPENKLQLYKDTIDRYPDSKFIFSDFNKHQLKLAEPYRKSNTDIFPYIYDLADKHDNMIYSISGENLLELLFRGYPLYPSTFVIERGLHIQYRWDPLVMRAEDFNLIVKLLQHRFVYIDSSLATIRIHESNKSDDFQVKNHVIISSMTLYRDLYAPNKFKKLCNYHISRKYFACGKSYFKKSLYRKSLLYIATSLAYTENWKRLFFSVTRKLVLAKKARR